MITPYSLLLMDPRVHESLRILETNNDTFDQRNAALRHLGHCVGRGRLGIQTLKDMHCYLELHGPETLLSSSYRLPLPEIIEPTT